MKKKWKCSGVTIQSLDEFLSCLKLNGGVWFERWPNAHFENAGWVKSYQLNYIEKCIQTRSFWWPERVVKQ